MQHITIIAVGKAVDFCKNGIDEYKKRLSTLCRFDIIELPEEPFNEKTASDTQVNTALQREGKRILAAVPKGAKLCALCVEGKQLTSEGFAQYLEDAAISGEGSIAFAIGASHGLSDEVKNAASLKLSISSMTLPHQLARLVLSEQIYRAFMIRGGRTYHK